MPSKLRQFIDGEDMSVILRQEEDLGANDSYRKVPAVNAPLEQGLTAAQVRERKQNGYANVSGEKNTKSVSEIIKSNVFTYFNGIFIVLAILMFAVGAWKNCVFLFRPDPGRRGAPLRRRLCRRPQRQRVRPRHPARQGVCGPSEK